MRPEQAPAAGKLEAKSPYELRLDQGKNIPESAIKQALQTGEMGFVHSFTTGSTVDGPGVRLVAWTAGCQWRCRYCHNPDTWNMMNGTPIKLERAVQELGKYRHGLKILNGGFTLSGGEPLMQDRFAVKLFTAAKSMGIHTCIETNGYLGERLSDDELDAIDLVMLGLKTWGEENHRELVGKEMAPTLQFARRLAKRKRPIWVRFVLVPGVTDDTEIVKQIAKFAADLGNVQRVEVLPFHQMGRFKWKALNLDYSLENVELPTPALVNSVCDVFRAEGLKAV